MGRPPTHFETGISYLLPGPWVDRLAYVFAQIDVAKRELDKRFVMKSDVLWTEVNRTISENKDCK